MRIVKIRLKENSYNILIGRGILSKLGRELKKLRIGRDAIIVTNATVSGLYVNKLTRVLKKSSFTVKVFTVIDSEKAKSASAAFKLIRGIARYSALKRPFLIALGGGVIGDLTGFVASIYKRGIPYVQIPTTLLAQVDASIGGKTAIDLAQAKNLVGTFYQPKMVLIDIDFLKTLPTRQIRNALAEVVKYAVIKDAKLFDFLDSRVDGLLSANAPLLEKVVYRCADIKAQFVNADEVERQGKRTLLNYGHTFGHAIEQSAGYSSRLIHGEAVSIGMVIAAGLAVELNILDKKQALRIEALLSKIGLPTRFKNISANKILSSIMHDKKFINGSIRLVLPIRIGKAVLIGDINKKTLCSIVRSCKAE